MTKALAIAREVAGYAGALLISAGAGLIYLPAGLIVGGILLIGAAIAPLKVK